MRALFDVNAAPLHSFLLKLTRGQRETAEDLLQETMLRAWRNIDQLPDEPESMRRWLFTVARNQAIDAIRTRAARPPEVFVESGFWNTGIDDGIDQLLDRLTLRVALERLSEHQRSVLDLQYCQDASMATTAAELGIPEGTVRSRTFYALRNVRERLLESRSL